MTSINAAEGPLEQALRDECGIVMFDPVYALTACGCLEKLVERQDRRKKAGLKPVRR